jgi:hypothetical protein
MTRAFGRAASVAWCRATHAAWRHRLGVVCLPVVMACGSRSAAPDDRARTGAATWDASLVDTLLRLGREDQAGRELLTRAADTQDTGVIFAVLRADAERTEWLKTAVAERGWPDRESASDSAHLAAWFILQHSPDNPWQAAMLPELEARARRGLVPLDDIALLTDRVLVHRREPQRYGTQFDVVDGRLVPEPVEDPEMLDVRRADMQLPPMAEYLRLLGEQSGMPVVWPPPP